MQVLDIVIKVFFYRTDKTWHALVCFAFSNSSRTEYIFPSVGSNARAKLACVFVKVFFIRLSSVSDSVSEVLGCVKNALFFQNICSIVRD